MPDDDGRRFGKYQIGVELGAGGFGTVFKATDSSLDRPVALKILNPLLMVDQNWVQRFRREARMMARLDHPHIVPVFETGTHEGRLFIAMKLIDGPNLASRLAAGGPFSWEEMLDLVSQIASALDYAHGQGLIHRDLKPSNILLANGQAILTDFGLSVIASANTMSLSLTKGIVGTPSYIPPEGWESGPVSGRADQYALACLVFEMLTGNILFTGETPPAIMKAHYQPPEFPEVWPAGIPVGIDAVLATGLATRTEDRYSSCGELVDALRWLQADTLAHPYARLQAAVWQKRWAEALELAGQIRAVESDYRDVVALEKEALSGQLAAQKAQYAGEWAAQAREALAGGNVAAARTAARKWQELSDDPEAAAFLERLERTPPKESRPPTPAMRPSWPDEEEIRPATPSPETGRRTLWYIFAGVAILIVGGLIIWNNLTPETAPPAVEPPIATLETVEEAEPRVEVEVAPAPVVTEVVPAEEEEAPEEPELVPAFEPLSVNAGSCDYGGSILSIEALDELTVRFDLCAPDPAFLAKITLPPFGIQSREWFEETGGAGDMLRRPVGTGPYLVEEWVPGEAIVFSRFEEYWGEPARVPTAVLRWHEENTVRLLALQAGEVDMITDLSPDNYPVVESDPNLTLVTGDTPTTFYVGMNNNFAPFNDLRVRRALAMGIDRQRIVDNYFPAGSRVASHFTPCVIPDGCTGEVWFNFDPDGARQLLAEAGYPDGFQTVIYFRDVVRPYLPDPVGVATELQNQLGENLGIQADLAAMSMPEFLIEATAGNLNGFYLLGLTADYPHITNFLDFHFNAQNRQFGNPYPEIYEPLGMASDLVDLGEAPRLYAQANNAIKELAPMVPLAHGATAGAARADLTNAYIPPFGATEFARLDLGDDVLVFMQAAEPLSLFCADETDGESFRACQQVTESLYKLVPDSGEAVPALAIECREEGNETSWTCFLRPGVKFHDGTTLDANDVVISWAVGIDAAHPYHVGNERGFVYYDFIWGRLMNTSTD